MEVLAPSRTPKNQILLSDMSISSSLSLGKFMFEILIDEAETASRRREKWPLLLCKNLLPRQKLCRTYIITKRVGTLSSAQDSSLSQKLHF